jgi:hypothetical protein
MKNDAFGHAEAPTMPRNRESDVHLRWESVGQVVQAKRGLMREHSGLFRPEPDDGQVFPLAGREVDEPIDAATHPPHTAALEVLLKELGRVAGLFGLAGGEVSRLGARRFIEAVPVGVLGNVTADAQNQTKSFLLCKARPRCGFNRAREGP